MIGLVFLRANVPKLYFSVATGLLQQKKANLRSALKIRSR